MTQLVHLSLFAVDPVLGHNIVFRTAIWEKVSVIVPSSPSDAFSPALSSCFPPETWRHFPVAATEGRPTNKSCITLLLFVAFRVDMFSQVSEESLAGERHKGRVGLEAPCFLPFCIVVFWRYHIAVECTGAFKRVFVLRYIYG